MDKIDMIQKEIELLFKIQKEMLQELLEIKKVLAYRAELDNKKLDNTKNATLDNNSSSIEGWTFSQRNTGSDEQYWYAGKRINGKLKWIYIGKDKNKAELKIKNWLEKQDFNNTNLDNKKHKKKKEKTLFD